MTNAQINRILNDFEKDSGVSLSREAYDILFGVCRRLCDTASRPPEKDAPRETN